MITGGSERDNSVSDSCQERILCVVNRGKGEMGGGHVWVRPEQTPSLLGVKLS
jgi:hypothetical protein